MHASVTCMLLCVLYNTRADRQVGGYLGLVSIRICCRRTVAVLHTAAVEQQLGVPHPPACSWNRSIKTLNRMPRRAAPRCGAGSTAG